MNVNYSPLLGNQSDRMEALNYYFYKPQDNQQFYQGIILSFFTWEIQELLNTLVPSRYDLNINFSNFLF